MKKKPVAKKVKKPEPVETGDKCEECGRLTDTILQFKSRYVCECCITDLETEAEQEKEREEEEDRFDGCRW